LTGRLWPFTDWEERPSPRLSLNLQSAMANPATAADPHTALSVEGAEKRFGSTVALGGASFTVRAGELVGLLGPNGAGKTTVIRAIAGRLRLDVGAIKLFGRALTLADKRPDIGVVPQELALYPLLTARENLEVFGALSGVAAGTLPDRVTWALEWSDLKDRAKEPVKQFSGGMKRRLNMACSLLHSPKLVLLDEPTVGVDPQSRERIYDMLAALQRQGVSIVLTTHHIEEAERRCERIVIIDHGKIVAAGTPAELMGRSAGGGRSLRVSLGSPLPVDARLPPGVMVGGTRLDLVAAASDVGRDLSALLSAIQVAGCTVTDVAMSGATLQDAFIALTGRELRE
jgi:ABC-2 type transport system ATP-binding protein